MVTSHRLNRRALSGCFLLVLALRTPHGQAVGATPLLQYEKPGGFGTGSGAEPRAWISDGLDGVIHVYAFQRFEGDFQKEFRRGLFRDRISARYREDRLLAVPAFKTVTVRGAESSLAASFKNFNGGAPREHFRVAILAAGFVALVDISANSGIKASSA
jgi:hypothetical protein